MDEKGRVDEFHRRAWRGKCESKNSTAENAENAEKDAEKRRVFRKRKIEQN
jgi:hypothetical protein